MSSSKPRINIERALRELNLQVSQRYEPSEHPLTEISSNIPSSKEFSHRDSKDGKESTHRSTRKKNNKENPAEFLAKPKQEMPPCRNSTTYVAISKALEQKTHLIGQQKQEIEVLRQCVEDVKQGHTKDSDDKAKSAQLAVLKSKEKECLEGLSQILGLKDNLTDIKRKYNALQQEKSGLIAERNSLLAQRSLLANRFNSIFAENEELTIAITHLKIEKQDIQSEKQALEAQVTTLKEQIRLKTASDERMLSLERRLSQSMEKLGETQEQLNNWQMKYYRLQQEGDLARHDGEQRLTSALRQFRTEREEHEQEVSRLTASLRQSEQKFSQQERMISQLQEKLKGEDDSETMRLRESKREEDVRERLRQVERKWESYTQELTKQFQVQKEKQINTFRTETNSLQQEVDTLKAKLENTLAERQAEEVKSLELMNQREHMIRHFSGLISEKQEQAKRSRTLLLRSEEESSKGRDSAQAKGRQERQILLKIEELERRMTEENERLAHINASLQQQLDQTTSLLSLVTSQRDSLNRSKDQTEKETRYYREKYEQQLLQYNSLSEYSHGVEVQQASLLASHTAQLIEANSLKAELALLSKDLNRLTQGPSQSDFTLLQKEIQQLRKELDSEEAEVTALRREAARWKLQATSLQTEIGRLQLQMRREEQAGREWQLRAQQRQSALREVRGQLSQQVQQIHNLTISIASIQDKYSSLHSQHQQQLAEWGRQSQAVRIQHCHLANSRLSAEYQLDNSHTALSILTHENQELQRIFTLELERRNDIIRELMAEKRSLFGKLVGREDSD